MRIAHKLDPIAIWTGKLTAWLIIPMILSLAWEVVARYGFGSPTVWAYDMTFMLFGAFFMLGAAYTLQARRPHPHRHRSTASGRRARQGLADLASATCCHLPAAGRCDVHGHRVGLLRKGLHATNERFVSSPWMPVTWPFKAAMPLTGLLLAIQGFSEFCKSLDAAINGRCRRTARKRMHIAQRRQGRNAEHESRPWGRGRGDEVSSAWFPWRRCSASSSSASRSPSRSAPWHWARVSSPTARWCSTSPCCKPSR
jgi:TRAP-type mannitol/chloroaromatic compound transport system permease small subunit